MKFIFDGLISLQERGIQTMVVKSDKDDRYDKLRLSTHDGQTRVCQMHGCRSS